MRKNKINNRIKKDLNNYNGIKDIRYLFTEYEDEYEDIRSLFNENEGVNENKESPLKSIIVDIRNKLSKNGDKSIKKGLYYVEEMKSLGSAEIKNIKEKLIIFKNELIRRIELVIGLKRNLKITMETLNTKVLEILDIYLMKKIFTVKLIILNICLMKLKIRKIKLKQHTKKMLKKVFIILRK